VPVAVPSEPVTVWSPAAVDVHEAPVQEPPPPPMVKVVAEVASPRLLPNASSLRRVGLTSSGGDRRARGTQDQVVERPAVPGVTLFDGSEAGPVPTPLVAVTVNVYAWPLVRPLTVQLVPLVVQVLASGEEVAV